MHRAHNFRIMYAYGFAFFVILCAAGLSGVEVLWDQGWTNLVHILLVEA